MRLLFFIFLSIQLIAQDISWTSNYPLVTTYSSPRTTDLNNDGIEDVVSSIPLTKPSRDGLDCCYLNNIYSYTSLVCRKGYSAYHQTKIVRLLQSLFGRIHVNKKRTSWLS